MGLLEGALHAEPGSSSARRALATMLIRQGESKAAQSLLGGLEEAQYQQDQGAMAEDLSLHAVAVAQSERGEDASITAHREMQRAVFLDPSSRNARSVLDFCSRITRVE